MHYLDYNEPIEHGTRALPVAFYAVDERHPRYVMSTHWHKETELLRVRRGSLRMYVNDVEITLTQGDLIVLGEGVLHGADPTECAYECILLDSYATLMHLEACKYYLKNILRHTFVIKNGTIVTNTQLLDALDRLYDRVNKGMTLNPAQTVGALFDVFGQLAELDPKPLIDEDDRRTDLKAEQLKPALEYIEAHYETHITLETLARMTGLSPKYFCRFFRAIVHRTPIDYLNLYRAERAGHLLATTDMTIAEIAQSCGYADSSFFIKQFRKYKSTTPKKYRDMV